MYPPGDKYQRFEGNFKKGQKHGKGTLTMANGTKITGKWNNGLRVV